MKRHWRTLVACVWGILALFVLRFAWRQWYGPDTPTHIEIDIAGAFLLAAGSVVRLWASVHVRPCKGKSLATSGPYAHCRHPLYFGSILLLLGLCFIVQNTLFAIGTILLWIPAYIFKTRLEERELSRRYGQAFEDYRRATPYLIPRLSGKDMYAARAVPHFWTDAFVELPGIIGFLALGLLFEFIEHYI